MGMSGTLHGALGSVVVAAALATASCSANSDKDPKVFIAEGLSCDRPLGSPEAQDTNERVGGLRNEDFSVRFAQSTRLGVVTLVSGDFDRAKRELSERYGVALVAEFVDDDSGNKVIGFEQVRSLVDDACSSRN